MPTLQAMPGADPFTIPNDRWMEKLAPYISNRKLKDIVIPGTHDSGSYDIGALSAMSPDAPFWMQQIGNGLLATSIIAKWAVTQGSDITYQLMGGIRYFDLRVAPDLGGRPCCVHSKYGATVDSVLDQVSDFIASRPKEIVILHFQHFFNMGSSDHDKIIDSLQSKLGNKMARYPGDVGAVTPADLYAANTQVIVIYSGESGGDNARSGKYTLWPDPAINSPDGGGFQDINALKQQLDGFLWSRDPQRLLVLQCVLTPDGSMVTKGLVPFLSYSSSLRDMAKQVTPDMVAWIASRDTQPLNIIIVDYFDLDNMPVTSGDPLIGFVHQCKRINMKQKPSVNPQPVAPHTQ